MINDTGEPAPSNRFLVALSFPGAKREFVREVAGVLADIFGRRRVFYDSWYKAELAKANLDLMLGDIYLKQADLVVPFLCEDFGKRAWCGLEWRQMRSLLLAGDEKRIMPFRFDREPIRGMLDIDGYVEIYADTPENRANPDRTVTPEDVAELILKRLNIDEGIPVDGKETGGSSREDDDPPEHADLGSSAGKIGLVVFLLLVILWGVWYLLQNPNT